MSEAVRSLAPPPPPPEWLIGLGDDMEAAGVSGDWELIRFWVSESCRIFCFCSKVNDDVEEAIVFGDVMLVIGASFLLRSLSIRPVASAPVSFFPTNESRPSPEYILSMSEEAEGAATNWSGFERFSDMLI